MRTISPLSPELTRLLFDAGPRAIVLVEGKDDREILREWFSHALSEVEFYECGGLKELTDRLAQLLAHSQQKHVYGIIDRDFRSAEEVAQSYADTSHLFILRRYALENYLLEPKPVWEELRLYDPQGKHNLPDEQALADWLLALCGRLKCVMAANWVFFDENGAQYQASGVTAKLEYFSTGHHLDRSPVIQRAARQLRCTKADAQTRIAAKETLLDQQLAQLDTAHQIIDGKRLLHWVHLELFRTLEQSYLRRLLIRTNKHHGPHPDITLIVQERILTRA